jgi:ATPase subunit of ABC transporter with duplicated ATPase domains
MTSHDREFMNRLVSKIVEIDGGELRHLRRQLRLLRAQRASARPSALQAQYERQQAMLAKEIRFIERFKAQAGQGRAGRSRGSRSSTRSRSSSRRGAAGS